jgi:hypothetical protein
MMHGAEASDVIVDGGWTLPFDRNRFVLSYGGAILGAITRDPGLNALKSPDTSRVLQASRRES